MHVRINILKPKTLALLKVPYGETASYLDLAKAIHNPKAVRAVAFTNGANAIALIIPCHRIIESNGNLGGYGGGINIKKKLLKMESEQMDHNLQLFLEI